MRFRFRPGTVGGQDCRVSVDHARPLYLASCNVRTGYGASISKAATGTVQSQQALPGVSAPVFLSSSGALVYAGSGGLTVRRPSGLEVDLGSPAGCALDAVSRRWLDPCG